MKTVSRAVLLFVSLFSLSAFSADMSLTSGQNYMGSDDGASLFNGLASTPPSERDDEFPPDEASPIDPPACEDNYFDWGQGRDGTGYCYEFYREGEIANGGRNLPNRFCEAVSPSYYQMARGRDGYLYCYQFTPYHIVMNQGRPVPQGWCRY
ncbi:MAG: hypothetical protein HRT45_09305 [Bdellovibrionales bacterium]|nr:hypothetical protein [Bdellovibrionales bacterium]